MRCDWLILFVGDNGKENLVRLEEMRCYRFLLVFPINMTLMILFLKHRREAVVFADQRKFCEEDGQFWGFFN